MYVNKKFLYRRSKSHLRNVAALPCQLCGLDGQTQAAHSNQSIHGKGKGIKASDLYVAALCQACHYEIDQGNTMNKAERVAAWDVAFHRTVSQLLEWNMWPDTWDLPDEYKRVQ